MSKPNLKVECKSVPVVKLQLNAHTLEFNRMCSQYQLWFNDHDSFPSVDSLNDDDKRLAMWCDHIRRARNKTLRQDQINKLDSLTHWYWNKTDVCGAYRLLELKQWYSLHKQLPRFAKDNHKEKSLYSWCIGQRELYREGTLTPGRINGLESIPDWIWSDTKMKVETDIEIDYEEFFVELNEWYNTHQKLPSHGQDHKETNLAMKCDLIKQNINRLESQQIQRLSEVPDWSWGNRGIQYFMNRCKDLKLWVDTHDKYPSSVSKDDYQRGLGGWLKTQRDLYRQNKLTIDKVDQLEQLKDWTWNGNEGKDIRPFDSKYDDLVTFVNINHRLPSSKSTDAVERSLGYWCADRRGDYKIDKLNPDRIEKLDAIEEWYWNEDLIFDNRPFDVKYEEIKVWMTTHEKLPSEEDPDQLIRQMGRFCGSLRKSHRNGTLSQEKMEKLEQIYNWWWTDDTIQYKSYEIVAEELENWVMKNNYIPSRHATDSLEKYFGNWCARRRKDYRDSKLSADLINQLEAIPHWYWDYVRKMHSDVSLTWLKMIALTYPNLQTALSFQGEFAVPGTPYHVDGYDEQTNTIFEFYGDYWHGNPKFYHTINDPKAKKLAIDRFIKTEQRKQILISMGYQYVDIWEDTWKNVIKLISRAKNAWKKRRYLSQNINNPTS